jgi:peptidyl-prolyl cis-trans isomerase A (cyclophilin A)
MRAWKQSTLALSLGILCGLGTGVARAQTPATKKPAATTHPRTTHMNSQSALLQPALLHETAPEVYDAKFATTKGEFVIRVTRAWAPQGADRFYNLVKHHFYDNASFFRVLSGFVVQFGISADPQVSRAWRTATIPDDRVAQSNRPGFVTFATAGPNTRTTQAFINLGNNASLDGMGFSPFGEVTQGMDIVGQLYSGYGEGAPQGRGPEQGLIESRGKAYLDQGFPKLDSIKTATVLVPAAAAHTTPKP